MAKKDMMAAAGVCHSGRTKRDMGGIMGKVKDGFSDFGNKTRDFFHLEEGGSAKREKREIGGVMPQNKAVAGKMPSQSTQTMMDNGLAKRNSNIATRFGNLKAAGYGVKNPLISSKNSGDVQALEKGGRTKRAMGGTAGSVKEEFSAVNKTGGGKSINGALDREPLRRVKRAIGGVGKERKEQLY